MIRKKIIISIITILVLIIGFLIQINFLNYIKLYQIKPDIGIVLISCLGIISGDVPGLFSRNGLWINT